MSSSKLELAASETPLAASYFHHTPYYCEENVYFLLRKLIDDGQANSDGSDLFAVFISNDKKQVPLWHQKASRRADGIVLWDYHVICVQTIHYINLLQKRKDGNSSHLVFDLDSSLPFPSPLAYYISETVRASFPLFSEFERCFRIVHAPLFLRFFASDRRHMKDDSGNWMAEPPSYNVITAEGKWGCSDILLDGTAHNLNDYMSISSATVKNLEADTLAAVHTEKLGVVVRSDQLEEFFSQVS